jgi:hypothetical protein
MTAEDRIDAVARFGFTTRQAEFLVTVMRHSGVCLPRQYAAFAGIVYGQRTRAFFTRLVARRYASSCPCMHNRALVYHVHHQPLYRAVGEPHSRLRRPVSAASVVPRLMLLEVVLASSDTTWLTGGAEKVAHLAEVPPAAVERLSDPAADTGPVGAVRRFPDHLPIGIDPTGRAVFVYPMTISSVAQFRSFLRRHAPLFGTLPAWTLRIIRSAESEHLLPSCRAAVRDEFDSLPTTVGAALADGSGRLEFGVLNHTFRHLFPLVAGPSDPLPGAEEGEQVGERPSARPRPPWATSPIESIDTLNP